MAEQFGLVAFDLEQIIPAFFDDAAGELTLAVQGIGGDHFPIQSGQFFQEGGGRGLFATGRVFLLIVNGYGDPPNTTGDPSTVNETTRVCTLTQHDFQLC